MGLDLGNDCDNPHVSASTVVLPLVGVALGSLGVIAGQYINVRGSRQQWRLELEDKALAYRREVVREFLQEAQAVEFHDVKRYQDGRPPPGASTDQLWFLQKYLCLIIPDVKDPA